MQANVHKILASLNRPQTEVSPEEIALWCKHANYVTRVRYRTVAQELDVDVHHAKTIGLAPPPFIL